MICNLIGKLVLASDEDDTGNECNILGIILQERGLAQYYVAWNDGYTGWYEKDKINVFRRNLSEKRKSNED